MSQISKPIRIRIDPTNPGQFFACCGLLELADRLWGGAEGWFDSGVRPSFHFVPMSRFSDCAASTLMKEIERCCLTNTMTATEVQRYQRLSSMSQKERAADPSLETEKKALDTLWREAPLVLHHPFNLRLDWFADERAGGASFKTWAGQQSVMDIACSMKGAVATDALHAVAPDEWLVRPTTCEGLPFNFDSDLGSMGSDRDVGFSFDPLGIQVRPRPLIELCAFIGLQRFRPARVAKENRYRFSLWSDPLVPEVAAPTACLLESPRSRMFEFRLLYRTKYLKSFLPANPIGGNR